MYGDTMPSTPTGYGEQPSSSPPYPDDGDEFPEYDIETGDSGGFLPHSTKDTDYFQHQQELYTFESKEDLIRFLHGPAPFTYQCKLPLLNIIYTHYGKSTVLSNFKTLDEAMLAFREVLLDARLSFTPVDIMEPMLNGFITIMINMYSIYVRRALNGNERILQAKYTLSNEQRITQVVERDQQKKRGFFSSLRRN